MTKVCSTCKEEKDIKNFSRCFDGTHAHQKICKECKEIERKSKRHEWYLTHKDKIRERERMSRINRKRKGGYSNRNTHDELALKKWARHEYGHAVSRGDIIPLTWCQLCGKNIKEQGTIQAHHADYNHPYSVVYLCTKHHGELHTWINDTE